MKGSIKLSNCAAKIKNINNKASPKAKEVLELLSTKSRDSPPKSVVKESSSTLAFISFIASIPSLILLPGESPAETVADIYLLLWYNWGGLLFSSIFTTLSIWISSPLLFLTYIEVKSKGLDRSFWSNCPMTWYCLPSFIK